MQIRRAMDGVRDGIDEAKAEARDARRARRRLSAARARRAFAPAGQSTQLIVGATDADRRDDPRPRRRRCTARSGCGASTTPRSRRSPTRRPTCRRSPRRSCASTGCTRPTGCCASTASTCDELTTAGAPHLDSTIDPKLAWALRNRAAFPVDLNRAPRETLLRVPGLGVRSVDRIVAARRWRRVRVDDLARLRVPLARALPFVETADHVPRGARVARRGAGCARRRAGGAARPVRAPRAARARASCEAPAPARASRAIDGWRGRGARAARAERAARRTSRGAPTAAREASLLARRARRRRQRGARRRGALRVPRRISARSPAAVACHRDAGAVGRAVPRALAPHARRAVAARRRDRSRTCTACSAMERAVRRDVHKMHAFVRFRAVDDGDERADGRYVAWFEPRARRRGARGAASSRAASRRCAGRSSRPTAARTGTATALRFTPGVRARRGAARRRARGALAHATTRTSSTRRACRSTRCAPRCRSGTGRTCRRRRSSPSSRARRRRAWPRCSPQCAAPRRADARRSCGAGARRPSRGRADATAGTAPVAADPGARAPGAGPGARPRRGALARARRALEHAPSRLDGVRVAHGVAGVDRPHAPRARRVLPGRRAHARGPAALLRVALSARRGRRDVLRDAVARRPPRDGPSARRRASRST